MPEEGCFYHYNKDFLLICKVQFHVFCCSWNVRIKMIYWAIWTGKWVVADTTLPQMGTLVLYGTLELDHNNGTRDFVINCTYLVIFGGRLIVGYPAKPYLSNLLISLQGDHSTNSYAGVSGPPIGSKAIGNYYFLIMLISTNSHAKNINMYCKKSLNCSRWWWW